MGRERARLPKRRCFAGFVSCPLCPCCCVATCDHKAANHARTGGVCACVCVCVFIDDYARSPTSVGCLGVCPPNVPDCVPFADCQGQGFVNGGSVFYAYNFPRQQSSNTGYEAFETGSIFVVRDEGGQVWLVLNLDRPGNVDGEQRLAGFGHGSMVGCG